MSEFQISKALPGAERVKAAAHRAVDVPRLRDRLLEAWSSGVLEELLTAHPSTRMHMPTHHRDEVRGVNVGWSLREWETWLLKRLADPKLGLFYVTEDMTELVMQAAQASPTYEVHADRLPAESGFIVYAKPFCHVPAELLAPGQRVEMMAAFWAPVPDVGGGPGGPQPGLMVVTLQDTDVLMWTQPVDHLRRDGSPAKVRRILEQMALRNGPLSYHEEYPMPFGTQPWDETEGLTVQNQAIGALMTTWIMMSQRITEERAEPVPKHVRKRAAREGRPTPEVRTYDLRQSSRGKAVDPQQVREGEPARKYTKRWPVKGYGYWRNTWYPSRERHELQYVWVPEYMKGPAGAPLVGGARVGVLRK